MISAIDSIPLQTTGEHNKATIMFSYHMRRPICMGMQHVTLLPAVMPLRQDDNLMHG